MPGIPITAASFRATCCWHSPRNDLHAGSAAGPRPRTPEQFDALMRAEYEKYAKLVKLSGSKLDRARNGRRAWHTEVGGARMRGRTISVASALFLSLTGGL